jgi:DNA-binding transcriptional LysR family regulator
MDLNAAQLLVAAVRAGSLSAASQRSGVPLATLSRKLKQLEQRLGVQLVERSPRGVKLTEAGTAFYEHASRGVDALHDGALAATQRQATIQGRLRLSIPPAFEPWWDLLAEFQAQYPGVQVAVYTTERAVDLGIDGIDVALRVGTIRHESLVAKRLFRFRHVLVASRSFLKKHGTPTTHDALAKLPAAIWTRDPNTRQAWQLGERQITPRVVSAMNDYLQLRRRAVAGDFVTELPPFLAAEALRSGELVELLPRHPFPEKNLSLLFQRQQHQARPIRAYLDFCDHAVARYFTVQANRTGKR